MNSQKGIADSHTLSTTTRHRRPAAEQGRQQGNGDHNYGKESIRLLPHELGYVHDAGNPYRDV